MPDIDDPNPVGAVFFGKGQLVPCFRDGAGVDPLIAPRPSMVVKMVIDTRSARPPALVQGGETADIPPVIVGPKQRDIVRHAHARVVEVLHFLVEAPSLGNAGQIRVYFPGQYPALDLDDFLCQVLADGRAAVVFGAQAHGENALEGFVAPHTFAPELLQGRLLCGDGIIPVVIFFPVIGCPIPLLLRAKHRLLVRRAHDYAVFVRQPGIFRIVLVETVVPHCGPEVIAFEPQDQLKQIGVKSPAVIGRRRMARHRQRAVFFLHPTGQVRRFVIQKNAAILHRRRALHVFAGLHKKGRLVFYRDISPPIPRRDPDLLRKIINAVNGSPFVAPGDNQSIGHSRHRFRHNLD